MSITRTITVDDLTPEELATVFADMLADEQAQFFGELWRITRSWPGAGWCQQSSYITKYLDKDGRDCIATLAEWAADPEATGVKSAEIPVPEIEDALVRIARYSRGGTINPGTPEADRDEMIGIARTVLPYKLWAPES